MMTMIAAAVLLNQQPLPNAGELISKVMSNYASAQSIVAVVTGRVYSGTTTVSLRTDLQYNRPNQLFLKQQKSISGPVDEFSQNRIKSSLFVTDGKGVGYDCPEEARRLKGERSFESAFYIDGSPMDMSHLYTLARGTMLDVSVPMDFLIADTPSLKFIQGRIISCETTEVIEIKDKPAYVIEGEMSDHPIRGPFRMVVDGEGNLYEYTMSAKAGGPDQRGRFIQGSVQMSYTIDAKVNTQTDPAKYKVQ